MTTTIPSELDHVEEHPVDEGHHSLSFRPDIEDDALTLLLNDSPSLYFAAVAERNPTSGSQLSNGSWQHTLEERELGNGRDPLAVSDSFLDLANMSDAGISEACNSFGCGEREFEIAGDEALQQHGQPRIECDAISDAGEADLTTMDQNNDEVLGDSMFFAFFEPLNIPS